MRLDINDLLQDNDFYIRLYPKKNPFLKKKILQHSIPKFKWQWVLPELNGVILFFMCIIYVLFMCIMCIIIIKSKI